jgi:hypothetical protein
MTGTIFVDIVGPCIWSKIDRISLGYSIIFDDFANPVGIVCSSG